MNEFKEANKFPIRIQLFIKICSLVFLFGWVGLACTNSQTATTQQPDQVANAQFTLKPTAIIEITATMIVTPQDEVTTTPQPSDAIPTPLEREIAYVIHVIDGDTIEVILNSETLPLRYIGIDSPESSQPYSSEAAEANRQLVEGKIVELERDVSDTDQYGRLLRYVYLDDGRLVNAELVRFGYAMSIAYPPDIKYQVIFDGLQREAQENGSGLWAPQTATASPTGSDQAIQIIVDASCSQFNAPGNDNDNKNEEYVCLVNQGMESVDMAGWSIRDEYGWTYLFQEYSLASRSTVKVRTGCGTNTQQDLYWCKDETAVWNNDGDCVYVLNSEGEKITEYCY
jgi:micrococcal nuclease